MRPWRASPVGVRWRHVRPSCQDRVPCGVRRRVAGPPSQSSFTAGFNLGTCQERNVGLDHGPNDTRNKFQFGIDEEQRAHTRKPPKDAGASPTSGSSVPPAPPTVCTNANQRYILCTLPLGSPAPAMIPSILPHYRLRLPPPKPGGWRAPTYPKTATRAAMLAAPRAIHKLSAGPRARVARATRISLPSLCKSVGQGTKTVRGP
jgi:hypothetical protein